MTNYAYDIKHAVLATELFPFYGFELNRAGFCKSPFATEKTPSLKVYSGTRGWHDFSSGKGGDVIDFVREYFGLGFVDAQKKINDDFRLGLPIGEELTPAKQMEADKKIAERRRIQEERRKAQESLLNARRAALDRWITLDIMRRKNEPRSPEERLNEEYVYALKNIDKASYDLDVATVKLHEFLKNTVDQCSTKW